MNQKKIYKTVLFFKSIRNKENIKPSFKRKINEVLSDPETESDNEIDFTCNEDVNILTTKSLKK